jgi:hypothetical protein
VCYNRGESLQKEERTLKPTWISREKRFFSYNLFSWDSDPSFRIEGFHITQNTLKPDFYHKNEYHHYRQYQF